MNRNCNMRFYHYLMGATIAFTAFGVPAHAVTIDNFSGAQTLLANSGTPTDDDFLAGGMLGGERDISIGHVSGPSNVDLSVDSGGNGRLSYSEGSETQGTAVLVWDGVDTSTAVDTVGLTPADLTDAGASNSIAFQLLSTDFSGSIVVTLWSGAGNSSTGTLVVPSLIGSPTAAPLLFSSFSIATGTGANFAAVTAIQMELITPNSGTDWQIDLIESTFTAEAVPEPATWVLALIGLCGLGILKQRRRF